jgi:nicotinate-nucleotide adenylyltransferase
VRTALFGGTFDPIHTAHLTVAREALSHLKLDRVLFIPNGIPPHKSRDGVAHYRHRYRMVELACLGEPRFVASRVEEGNHRSYSIDTIERIRNERPEDELFFLIGADAFAEIESWRRWRDVLEAVEFIVVTRPGHDYDVPAGSRVHRLETVALPVSSSEIRDALARGDNPPELPASVLNYIREHNLYQLSSL